MSGDVPFVPQITTQIEPADFDSFWAETLAAAEGTSPDITLAPHPAPLTAIDVYDVSFRGFGGDRVRAWLRVPRHADDRLPGAVQFYGYGNGRGHALRDLRWAAAGYAHLAVDARGQGHGDTPDPHDGEASSGTYLTRGLLNPETYYYRRVFVDAVRAVAALRCVDIVDPDRVGVVGASQGGAIALAMTGLVDDLAFAAIQAPFLCEMNRAPQLSRVAPYAYLAEHLAARRDEAAAAQRTLQYFDGVNHAKRAKTPAILSTGLRDEITPPETVLPAFTAYAGPKRTVIWPYNGHEAGGEEDEQSALRFAAETLAAHRPTTTHLPGAEEGAPALRTRNT